jgi:hypothetical protein
MGVKVQFILSRTIFRSFTSLSVVFFSFLLGNTREMPLMSGNSFFVKINKFQLIGEINERNHYCECGQLETVEHVLKECPLHSAKRDYLRKVSPELDPKIPLDTKKGLGAVVKFLDFLPQLLY